MKSETINIQPASSSAGEEALVETFMLQQHRSLLIRQVVGRVLTRILFVATILFILTNQITFIGMVLYMILGFLIGVIWMFENYLIESQIRMIERTFAKLTGGVWEDIYIQLRYESRGKVSHTVQHYESTIWTIIICVVATARHLSTS